MSRATPDLAGLNADPDELLAGILEAIAQPIWVVDHAGVIRFANAAAATALGYERADELLGRPSHETIYSRRAEGSYVSVPLQMRDGRGAVVAFNDAALAAQEASLRRVATLVAAGAASGDVFAAVAEEVGRVMCLPLVTVWRYEAEGTTATVVGAWGEGPHPFQADTRWPLDGPGICAQVLETGVPARIDDFAALAGTIAQATRETGIYACAGAPILVDGDVWGAISADSTNREPLPDDIEDRLAEFTELVAAAISTTASRAELARLADEQAALRRVATLVARGVPPPEVFAAVAREVALLLGIEAAHMGRFEPDGAATVVGAGGPAGWQLPVGTRVELEGDSVAGLVARTGRSAWMHDYEHASGPVGALGRELGLRSAVGAPIVVDQRLWGVMIASTRRDGPLPEDAESRIAAFTELVATAISNTEARTQRGRLADEQAALRRVATIVAQGAPPDEVFCAATDEAGVLLGADLASMVRFESDDTLVIVAGWAATGEAFEAGVRLPLTGTDLATTVLRTGRPARTDHYEGRSPSLLAARERLGIRSSVGSPIVVEGQVWGLLVVHSRQTDPLAADTESRLTHFTELVAASISNVEARSELAASRARVVAAADAERRRVVRDLHDGAQQRLVQTIISLKLAHRALPPHEASWSERMTEALEHAELANVELRELAHGILPAVLTRGGLRAGLDALASRAPVPVEIEVPAGRLPSAVEATAYFIVAEALTNVAKHARAGRAEVTVRIQDGTLAVQVRDDGVGGARPDGSGLVGLADRLAVHDGRLRVESPADGGTLVVADIPLRAAGVKR